MNLLFCGDIVGKSGRAIVLKHISNLRKQLKLDFVIVNAENSAHGFGVTPSIADTLLQNGVDCITLGNHTFDKLDIIPYLQDNNKIIRPHNFVDTHGLGIYTYDISCKTRKITVINLLGKIFTHSKHDFVSPFEIVDDLLNQFKLKENTDAIFIDFHAEATSEKLAFANYIDGKVSAVIGTHTHVPTLDYRILPQGTAYQSDVGMCGDYDSVIGMQIEDSLNIFLNRVTKKSVSPAQKDGTLCAIFIEINPSTGLAKNIKPIIIGEHLTNIN